MKLQEELARRLIENSLTISVAESCTGGLLSSTLTDVPGSSSYFLAGMIAYQNEVKQQFLHVPANVLKQQGAVSEETAIAMARGCQQAFCSDLAIATTGIAGPGGGTTSKPVGLVYVAVINAQVVICRRFMWSGTRKRNNEQTVTAALRMTLSILAAS